MACPSNELDKTLELHSLCSHAKGVGDELPNANPPPVFAKLESKESLGYNIVFCMVSCL